MENINTTIRDVSVTSSDGNKIITVQSGDFVKLRIFVHLTGAIQNVQIYLGIRGYARGFRTDFNTEGANYSKKLATASHLIFDGTENGSGGYLHGGTHGFDVLINSKDLLEDADDILPPSFKCEDKSLVLSIKYLVKVLVTWPGSLNSKLKKDAIAELIIKPNPMEKAKLLQNPYPYIHSKKGLPSLCRESYDRERKLSKLNQKVEWDFVVSRQAVIPGDIVQCMIVYRSSLSFPISSVRVSLMQRSKYKSQDYGYMEFLDGTRLVEEKKEMHAHDPRKEYNVQFSIMIPKDISPTMRFESMSHDLFILFEVLGIGKTRYERMAEVPITVVDALPEFLIRNESKLVDYSQHDIIDSDLTIVYAHVPKEEDEILVEMGDLVDVKQSFEDGWSLILNRTRFCTGLVPSYCLVHRAERPNLPRDTDLITEPMREIIQDLRTLCKLEERYHLHMNTLSCNQHTLVTPPQLAYLLKPKSRLIRILKSGSDECDACLSHQGIL